MGFPPPPGPLGPAGGDLSGTFPNPLVAATHLGTPLPIAQGGWGSTPGIYVPPGWGARWTTAVAGAASTPAVLAISGDSITAGAWSSNLLTKPFAALLAARLQTAHGDGGSGFFSSSRCVSFNSGFTYSTPDQCAALDASGHWIIWSSKEGAGATGMLNNFTNATMTYQVRGTKVGVYFVGRSDGTTLGSFNWKVDGVDQGNVNTSTQAANGIYKTLANVGAGNHTILITALSAATPVVIQGAYGENTTGVIVNVFGRSGAVSADFELQAGVYTYGHPSDWSGGISYPSDCLIYALGVNDAHNQVSPGYVTTGYLQNLGSFLASVKNLAGGRNGNTDVLVLMNHVGNDEIAARNGYMQYYAHGARVLCEHYGAALINMNAVIGTNYAQGTAISYWSDGTTSGLPGSDVVHPGDTGHQKIYNTIAAAVPVLVA